MPVELATYISDLNLNNPASSESAAQGDDHLRLIKSALKATFPNIAGAVTPSHTLLNGLDSRIQRFEGAFVNNGLIQANVDLNLNFKQLLNTGTPTDPKHVATKEYVDAQAVAATTAARLPVGSVFLTAGNTNPGTLLGYGTWTQRAQGQVLLGVGSSTDKNGFAKTFTAGANLGEHRHTLSVAELATHGHTWEMTGANGTSVGSDGGFVTNTTGAFDAGPNTGAVSATGGSQIGATGSSTPFALTSPSFGVYVWERTA